MNSKTVIQLSLFLFLLLLIYIFLNKYFFIKDIDSKLILREKEVILNENISNKNIIKEIKYISKNKNNDSYEIYSPYGEIDINNTNKISMINVEGKIILNKGDNILIFSDKASFNNKSFETKFSSNVRIFTKDEIITGDNLHLILDVNKEELKNNPNKEQNIVRMTENISIKRQGYNLKADVLEIDLITKNLQIFMNDERKVKIKSN